MEGATWHDIALGSISLIILLAGVVWMMTTKRLDSMAKWMGTMSEALTEHTAEDTRRFESVMEKMNQYHIETLKKIGGRR